MIDKNYNLAILGKNYLSILLGMEFIEWDQKIILIDDDRVGFGGHYTDYLCLLEYNFLTYWGEDRQIEPLQKLKHYVVKKPFTLVIDQKRVQLGHSPSQNLVEYFRKFSSFIKEGDRQEIENIILNPDAKKELDEEYYEFCYRLAENSFKFRTTRSLSLSDVLSLCPAKIKTLFKIFEVNFINFKSIPHSNRQHVQELKTFLYLISGIFHRKLSVSTTDFELFHLFMSLLSPHFELDHTALLKDLLPAFTQKGGVFKKSNVEQWLFDRSRPWSLQLSSFEGVIHPQKIFLLGGRPESLPIKIDVADKTFRSVTLKFAIDQESCYRLGIEGGRVFYTRREKVGGLYPFWEGRFTKDSGTIKVYTRSYKGMKVNFIREFLISVIEKDLSLICKRQIQPLKIDSLEFSSEMFLEQSSFKNARYRQDTPTCWDIKVKGMTIPGKHQVLKGVHYLGPLKRASFGLFSTMMEIKDGPSLY